MITVTVQATSLADFKQKIEQFLNEAQPARLADVIAQRTRDKSAKLHNEKLIEDAKKISKRGRKAASTSVEEQLEMPTESAPAKITKEQLNEALQRVNMAKGINATRNILRAFNCQKVSEIPPESYSDVYHACMSEVEA